MNSSTVLLFFSKDPFREARLLASEALHQALHTVDFTSDPPLNVPDKYKHMVWFALPIDIVLMMRKQNSAEKMTDCDINSIPFMPEHAMVSL